MAMQENQHGAGQGGAVARARLAGWIVWLRWDVCGMARVWVKEEEEEAEGHAGVAHKSSKKETETPKAKEGGINTWNSNGFFFAFDDPLVCYMHVVAEL
jgi:hypothetical protein